MDSFYSDKSYSAFLFDELEVYHAVIADLLATISEGHGTTHTHNNLGIMYWEIGEIEKARSSFSDAIEKDATNAMAYKNLGMFEEKSGNRSDALSAFTNAVELQPQDISILLNNAYFLLKDNRPNDAIPFFERAIALGCDNEIAHQKLKEARELLLRGAT